MNLPDPRDIDRVLFRGRETFDLGFMCDGHRGWCALMNNPEGIQNPGVSSAPQPAGLADSGVRLVILTSGSVYSKAPVSVPPLQLSSTTANTVGKTWAGRVPGEGKSYSGWNMWYTGLAWPKGPIGHLQS